MAVLALVGMGACAVGILTSSRSTCMPLSNHTARVPEGGGMLSMSQPIGRQGAVRASAIRHPRTLRG